MLTRNGVLAAFSVGVLTFCGALFGWTPVAVPIAFAVLFGFFITSVAFTRVGRRRKRMLVDIPKGGPRDAIQVAANGGVATLCAVVAALLARGGTPPHVALALLWGFVGAYAAATADTWSTEIGSAFGGMPRSIVGFRPVAVGLSGGVTLLGSAMMLAGAVWIGLIFAQLQHSLAALWIVTAAGVAGGLIDSLLGATLQPLLYCQACERSTETPIHRCGNAAVVRRGLPWMTNDAVNALATLTGAVVSGGLYALLA